jgi:glucose-6-phosphate-specific signal transduction histidine kinase
VPVRLHVHLDRRLPEPTELGAYFATAEAMANVATHAQATVVDLQVDADDDALQIVVRDDGRGGADLAGGTGLIGLKDRIEALDGHLTVHSPPTAGTTWKISLPIDDTNRPGQVRHLPAGTNPMPTSPLRHSHQRRAAPKDQPASELRFYCRADRI